MVSINNKQTHTDHHPAEQPPRTPPRVLADASLFSFGIEEDGAPRQELNHRYNRLWTRADYEESDSEASDSNDGGDDNMYIAGQPPCTPCKP